MIRRISSLAFGIAITFAAASALAQEEGGEAGGGEAPAGGEEAAPAAGGGEAKAGGEASASASMEGMPESKGAFGKSGQIAISGDLILGFESRKSKPPSGPEPDATTTVAVLPALDYFVADSISVGGQLGIQMVKQGDNKLQEIVIGPRIGYNLGLTENISFWPKVAFAYKMLSYTDTTVDPTTGASTSTDVSGNKMTVMVHAPVLYHPAEHFFIGLGPSFEMDISSKVEGNDANKDTAFGAMSVVGGWF